MVIFNKHCFNLKTVLLFLFCLGFSANSQAATNVLGSYSGTVSGTKTVPGPTTTPFSTTVDVVIASQSGASFSGTVTLPALGVSSSFSGTVLSSVDIDVSPFSSGAFSGAFAAKVTGTSMIIPNGAGSFVFNISGDVYDVGGTLSRSGEEIIEPENTSGTTLKSAGTIRSEVKSITSPVHSHLQKTLRGEAKGVKPNETGFLLEAESGINAGDLQLGNLGLWLSYNYTATENNFSRTAFESDSHSVVGGVDFSPVDTYVFGLAFSYESSDADTIYNRGNIQTEGISLVPYIGILLSDHWSLDASYGRGWLTNDQFRVATGTTTRITSAPDSERWFLSMNLNGISFHNNWVIGGRLGVLIAENETEDFLESDGTAVFQRETSLGEFLAGGDVAYSFGHFEPFVSATYEYDFTFEEIVLSSGLQPANDRDDILLAAGFRYFGDQGLTANFIYSKRVLREEFEEDSINLTVRWDW